MVQWIDYNTNIKKHFSSNSHMATYNVTTFSIPNHNPHGLFGINAKCLWGVITEYFYGVGHVHQRLMDVGLVVL